MQDSTHEVPTRAIRYCLWSWSLALVGGGTYYAVDGQSWAWLMIVVGALTALVVWRSRGADAWSTSLFGALYVAAVGMIVAGPVTGLDAYIVGGIVSLVILVVGTVLTIELRRLRSAVEGANRS